MSYRLYERLTAADEVFLDLEDAATQMHVGAVCIYDLAPLQTAAGGLDFPRLYRQTEAALPLVPRFRQRLAAIPLFGRPVWVDDEHFNLHYHLRHTALPRPGDVRQLKRLAGRILSQPIDRRRPLWEMWFIEGLAGEQFAVISKVHHCMLDGVAGADLLAAIMAVDPEHAVAVPSWRPRPHPSGLALVADELARRTALLPAALRAGREVFVRPRHAIHAATELAKGLAELARVTPVSASPLNVPIGPHRRFDWTRFDLAAMRAIGHRLGGTVNDVALAIVTAALHATWRRRGIAVDAMDCRALVSVSLRSADERGALGNRVATMLATLPMDETNPARRLQRVAETMRAAKASHQVLGMEIIEEVSDWTFASLLVAFARLALRSHSYTIDVTNVPGPSMPMCLLGAQLREIYGLTPLVHDQALAIALFSYNGGMHWGFNADWEALPELHQLVKSFETEFAILRRAASGRPAEIAARATPAARPVRQRGRRPVRRTNAKASGHRA
jgi:diacylglycerol O-acyltransferase / wax synthase